MPRRKKVRDKTLVNYIIDESGSMQGIADQVRSGFTEYVNELKKDEGDIRLTLTKFDTVVETVYTAKPVSEIDSIDYAPDGMTALYDAVGKTVRAVEKDVDKDTKVITVIMTDGLENSSREWTETQLNSLITEKQNEGNWTFVFLGADQDAWATASKLGVYAGNTMSYASASTGHTHSLLARATSSHVAAAASSTPTFFSDAGQSAADYNGEDDEQQTVVTGTNTSTVSSS